MIHAGALSVAVVVPVLNDWPCFEMLLTDLNRVAPGVGSVSVFAIDDGSTETPDYTALSKLSGELRSVEIVHLHCNLGHQRAIAVGLATVEQRGGFDVTVVIDSDGEDRPDDLLKLVEAYRSNPAALIVAQRRSRSENLHFRAFYGIYWRLFHLLTGRRLDFGNFSLLGADSVSRITRTDNLWNNYPATLMRSRVDIVRVPIDRHKRYTGESRMSFVGLVNHGLGAMSVFVDAIFVRLLVLVAIAAAGFISVACVAIGIRLATDFAVPGWTTTVLGLALLGTFQIFALLVITAFMLLANRATVPLVPTMVSASFVKTVTKVWGA